jgi:hypothetical protein
MDASPKSVPWCVRCDRGRDDGALEPANCSGSLGSPGDERPTNTGRGYTGVSPKDKGPAQPRRQSPCEKRLPVVRLFVGDLRDRLANRVQLTSDGHGPYLSAVDAAFGEGVDYAMLIKLYGADPQAEIRYSPAKCIGAKKKPVTGNPDNKHISTSYVERSNLTMRMHMRRFTRLTNAFSKKVENHAATIALHTFYYNFVRIHQTLKVSPAMAAGVSNKLWEMNDLVAMLEQWELSNFKPEYQFVVRQYAIGKGHSVSVLWRGGEVDTIFGFEKEDDALRWIKEKSQGWITQQKSPAV